MSSEAKLTDQDRWLAAEYALGVLDRDAMASASARITSDPAFRDAVEAWQAQLAPMLDEVEEITPGSAVWKNIEQEIFAADRSASNVESGAGVWKLVSGVFGMAAAACFAMLIYVTGGDFSNRELDNVRQQLALAESERDEASQSLEIVRTEAENLSGELQTAQARIEQLRADSDDIQLRLAALQTELSETESELGTANQRLAQVQRDVLEARPLVASLTQSGDAPAFVAQFDPLKKALLIRTAAADEDEKVPEVWLIPAQGDRKGEVLSLGVMNEAAPDELAISSDFISLIGEGGTLAITMEPPGGAPNGVATGPVIALGQLQSF